jgi:hypothetical protein
MWLNYYTVDENDFKARVAARAAKATNDNQQQ